MRRNTAFSLMLVFGLALVGPALGQSKKSKAKRMFDKGIAALEDHDYKTALDSFDAAYKSSPHWMVLAHIGTCHAKLNNPVSSIWALEKYLEEGGEDIEAEERQAARTLLSEQRKKVGVLHLIVEPSGTKAKIDGESIGKSPFERRLLKAGPHHIIVIAEDEVIDKDIHISPGQEHTLRIPEDEPPPVVAAAPALEPDLEEEPSEEPTAEEPSSEEAASDQEPYQDEAAIKPEKRSGMSVPFFVALGFSGVGLITAGISWPLFAHNRISENNYRESITGPEWDGLSWSDPCDSGNTLTVENRHEEHFCDTEAKRRDFADKARTILVPAIIGSGVFVAGGITALVFYFNQQWFVDSEASATLTLTPVATSSHTGLVLSGTF
ncbi:MAG: hypothetical protein GY854_11645 [Deltaproteobacteria bacterium]|nr:hypothetical protein [Deltaproteobacteria bacterium]